ncbi:hypothetical protein DD582_33595, partial [Klebsiella pneumoniae]|uniref:BamA/TamA family outer membrane protein n=1 Tax=Klebsiella pneumoniae TaxID=573 RepID=UPI0010276EAA
SLGYQYNAGGKLVRAVLVVSGASVSDLSECGFKTGTGAGVRWQAPVGSIKLDIARPIGDKEEHGLQFYIGLGPEL